MLAVSLCGLKRETGDRYGIVFIFHSGGMKRNLTHICVSSSLDVMSTLRSLTRVYSL